MVLDSALLEILRVSIINLQNVAQWVAKHTNALMRVVKIEKLPTNLRASLTMG
jgi:hypothetical protein